MLGGRRRDEGRRGWREMAPLLLALGGLCLFVLPIYKLLFAIDTLPDPAQLAAISGDVLAVETGAPFGHRGKSAAFGRTESVLTVRLTGQAKTFYYLNDWPGAERLRNALHGRVTVLVWPTPVPPLDAEQLWQVEKDGAVVVAAKDLIAHLDAGENWKRVAAYGVTFLGFGLLLASFAIRLAP
ncbi:MAG: hypothetical protein FJX68_18675 [Alphaproteobacteria bacterium]|nr:hypothetical protein [Alphaproteobacteria bacterium]